MKNTNLAEKTGFALIIIGFVFMLLNDVWKSNPIPTITDKHLLFSSIGLLIWSLGYQSSINKKNKEG